eukprot:evm.model.scf_1653.3 EVM.evm.TU.scf_1653.3   scf_1653:33124-35364(+)
MESRGPSRPSDDPPAEPDRAHSPRTPPSARMIRPPSMMRESSRRSRLWDGGLCESWLEPSEFSGAGEIGEGAFAVVRRCDWSRGDGDGGATPVALKMLKPHVLERDRDVEQFLKEADLLRRVRHPSIVEFMGLTKCESGCGEGRPTVAIVQEFADMGSMRSLIQDHMEDSASAHPAYSKREVLRWMLDIATAIQYLHESQPKIIHRDIKPENMLLFRDSNDGEVIAKLADFGLVALVHTMPESLSESLSAAGVEKGLEALFAAKGGFRTTVSK